MELLKKRNTSRDFSYCSLILILSIFTLRYFIFWAHYFSMSLRSPWCGNLFWYNPSASFSPRDHRSIIYPTGIGSYITEVINCQRYRRFVFRYVIFSKVYLNSQLIFNFRRRILEKTFSEETSDGIDKDVPMINTLY